ncbi:MAG: hypothetical protein WCP21_19045 [Armatimonadota bacterium]
MATELTYEVCPETGIGCVLVRKDEGLAKLDLMPDEVDKLKQLATAGDAEGIKALLNSVSTKAASALDEALVQELIENARGR